MMKDSLKVAVDHPDVKILNCSLNTSHKYIRTYYARMYEAKFLSGMIAGALAENDRIAYIADYPIYGMIANINAFALGASFTNPRARIYLAWSTSENYDRERFLKDNNIQVVSDQDMITPTSTARRFGLYSIDDETTQHIAMPMWHWGAFYEKMIQSILSGSWNREQDADNVKALNYWWGMSAGVVDLIYSESLPSATKRLVKLFEKELKEARFRVFEGELKDQQGNIRVEEGVLIDPEHIITMDWLLDNVVGRLPRYDELTDNAKLKMALQGVVKEEE
jgi:basic membrane lipoprotein Med (substrate-binding protein (PBP1-ABC) superfamily)